VVIGDAWDNISILQHVAGRGLAYFSGTDVNTAWSTGVPYSQAAANGWLLSCGSSLCVNQGYPSNYIGDIGSSAYQQAWISHVENYLGTHPGIDGIYIDDVAYDPRELCGTFPTSYPSTAAWSGAQISFMKAVYTALHAKGYYVAANADAFIAGDRAWPDGSSTVNWWKQVGPYADGLHNQYYDETPSLQLRATGTAWYQQWSGWQRLIDVAQSMGDDFLGKMDSKNLDPARMVYGKASFLLEWNGGGSVFMYGIGSGASSPTDPTNSGWTTNIGKPAGSKFKVGVGWERTYAKGTVLVNPSPTRSQTFRVKGTSYTLAPTTARILATP
jgi:hypothetical protein